MSSVVDDQDGLAKLGETLGQTISEGLKHGLTNMHKNSVEIQVQKYAIQKKWPDF